MLDQATKLFSNEEIFVAVTVEGSGGGGGSGGIASGGAARAAGVDGREASSSGLGSELVDEQCVAARMIEHTPITDTIAIPILAALRRREDGS